MLRVGTFRKDIKNALESQLRDDINKFEVVLLNKKQGILNADKRVLTNLEALFTTHLSLEEANMLPQLKTILVPMTGLDGLDEAIVNNEKYQILNAHSTAPYIAERGLCLLMTLAGRIVSQQANLKQGIWNRFDETGEWITLRNKKIGIYGYGHIGKAFESMVRPFTSNIYTIDRHKDYPSHIQLVKDIDELTKACDILFVSVPGNSQTENSVGEKEIKNLKDGLIINVGRGIVINQEAVYDALVEGSLLGFGSDVWYNYPKDKESICLPSDFPLHTLENVVMSPHNAWNNDHKPGLVVDEMVKYVKLLLD